MSTSSRWPGVPTEILVDGRIPFNRPYLVGTEFERMREAVEGLVISEGGPFTEACERLLVEMTGAGSALLTSSCMAIPPNGSPAWCRSQRPTSKVKRSCSRSIRLGSPFTPDRRAHRAPTSRVMSWPRWAP